ncbi:MAG: DUF1565 domain-containing protein, partial [Anaerolineae bacterium]
MQEARVHANPGTLYVDGSGGSDTANNCQTPATPCATIGHALSQAVNGDTILVAEETYTENLIVDKQVTLRGGYTISGTTWLSAVPGSSIIDGSGSTTSQPVVDFQPGSDGAILDGFNITGGSVGEKGGGINIESASPVIRSCFIQGNTALGQPSEFGGGGIAIAGGGSPLISNTLIFSNSALGGAGGVRVADSSFTMINSLVA